ncbi:hypothetical protein GCM10011409_00420 [Lentibacillus populi]|uniref:NERD domain-containing protein n=1 Tax=Lentibacillus populi TaxID=1827502 RepID=A0A9W5X3V4_9BACI|nr:MULTISPECIES: NERD domain-containing protein [Bacillaceae]MBT2216631.1 NERD domain-containing protein [Virgibacillus dakarensis]GGB27041.1 hypothetical protein GCM10011409_00420 [Lentibacillus populi]
MAQLIKLNDYISRYEWNMYRYPSQFTRLKQENWKKLHTLWETQQNSLLSIEQDRELAKSTFSKWKAILKREPVAEEPGETELPKTEQELKQYFLDKLLPLQLKWASSTVTDLSFMDQSFGDDETLKYFLQRFPDTYLVMYHPIFTIKKAPVEGEIIFISPIGIEVIYVLEEDDATRIYALEERMWMGESNRKQRKIVSPLFALKRTEQIIKSILKKQDIDFPVKKVVLSRTNRIIAESKPYHTNIIGKREYNQWFTEKRNLVSPLKNRQLKAAEALLAYCQSVSVKRPEWEEEESPVFSMDNEGL